MDKVNKQELRRLAEAAKDLDWAFDWMDKRAHALRNEANPAAILSLLDECDGLMAQHSRDSAELRSLCQARDEARRERDQLRAELEQYRKDALRYRWLRSRPVDCPTTGPDLAFWDDHAGDALRMDEADCAIDTAMAKEGGANG